MTSTANAQSDVLQSTLSTTKGVATEIRKAADQASVIGTVLEHELPEELQVAEVAQAIEQTVELEKKLETTADQLLEANAALKREIAKRQILTDKLDESRELVKTLSGEGGGGA